MDALTLLVGFVGGAASGGAAAWVLSAARARTALEPALRDAEARARGGAATVDELRREATFWRQRVDAADVELRRLEGERGADAARVEERERAVVAQGRLLDQAQDQLASTFEALAAETLRKNNEGFLQLATEKLSAARREGSIELAAREQAIAALVSPVKQSLDKFDHQVHALEQARGEAYVRLSEQVRALADGQRQLQSGTDNLVNALRAPAVRGRWGEIQLRRVMEMAGMIDHCDFVEQATVTTADGRLRPDVVVRLPGGKTVVVDAKAPLAAFLAAREAKTDEERSRHMSHHAEQVRAHAVKLGSKNYWEQFGASPELVVMFLPGDTFFAAALDESPELFEEAVASRVLIATPMTLIGLLRAVHIGWKQERLAENAEEISRCGRDLHERIATFGEHIVKIGASLGRTVEAFNAATGSFETRVLPSARRLQDLGAAGKKDVPDIEPIDTRPRALVVLSSSPPAGGAAMGDSPPAAVAGRIGPSAA